METMIVIITVLAAGLVMASGVWVTVVLVATVARTRRPTESPTGSPPSEKAGP